MDVAPQTAFRWHKDLDLPLAGEVFVFGSNLAGRHGAGAALVALQKFGARPGCGIGFQGSGGAHCYAIPTKDERLRVLPLHVIAQHVQAFLAFAHANKHLNFFITRVGCGLAGYRNSDIAPLFAGAPPQRCSFEISWKPFIGTASKS